MIYSLSMIYSHRDSPNEKRYQWIAYILLSKLVNNKPSNIDYNIGCNIQTQLDYIQIRNAVELCDNISDLNKVSFLTKTLAYKNIFMIYLVYYIFHYIYLLSLQ
jgi:hypothetical protein